MDMFDPHPHTQVSGRGRRKQDFMCGCVREGEQVVVMESDAQIPASIHSEMLLSTGNRGGFFHNLICLSYRMHMEENFDFQPPPTAPSTLRLYPVNCVGFNNNNSCVERLRGCDVTLCDHWLRAIKETTPLFN